MSAPKLEIDDMLLPDQLADSYPRAAGRMELATRSLEVSTTTQVAHQSDDVVEAELVPEQIDFDLKDTSRIADSFLLAAPRYATLRYYRSEFYSWREGRYSLIESGAVKHSILMWLRTQDANLTHPRLVDEILKSLTHSLFIEGKQAPFWIDSERDDAKDWIAFPSRLVNWKTGEKTKATPEFFNLISVTRDADFSSPIAFLEFLNSSLEGDQESIRAIREFMGLMLTYEKKYEKGLMLVGESRSGKGTIIKVSSKMLSAGATQSMKSRKLAGEFGLQELAMVPFPTVLAIPDAAFIAKHRDELVDVVKILTSRDQHNTPVKYSCTSNDEPYARLIMASNAVPDFGDDIAAIGRFIKVIFQKSFVDSEDPELLDRLLGELPRIIGWALTGLYDLRDRGRFIQPASGELITEVMKEAGCSMAAFVADCCVIEKDAKGPKSDFCTAYNRWAKHREPQHYQTVSNIGFGRKFMKEARKQWGLDTHGYYIGIRLR